MTRNSYRRILCRAISRFRPITKSQVKPSQVCTRKLAVERKRSEAVIEWGYPVVGPVPLDQSLNLRSSTGVCMKKGAPGPLEK
jgi:hypothetical protein